ncbi:hypothetical protein RSAG8_00404, partial [Rhizoctonia solani AG-8 WAC10335]
MKKGKVVSRQGKQDEGTAHDEQPSRPAYPARSQTQRTEPEIRPKDVHPRVLRGRCLCSFFSCLLTASARENVWLQNRHGSLSSSFSFQSSGKRVASSRSRRPLLTRAASSWACLNVCRGRSWCRFRSLLHG